eukprot:scaffold284119_cov22-Tisochrysis_lutea.AAC.1
MFKKRRIGWQRGREGGLVQTTRARRPDRRAGRRQRDSSDGRDPSEGQRGEGGGRGGESREKEKRRRGAMTGDGRSI